MRNTYGYRVDLHDVEFRSSVPSGPGVPGHHLSALPFHNSQPSTTRKAGDTFHLTPPHDPLGEGDQLILEALSTLRSLQSEGKIRNIGISGYPLPVLLRIALLTKNTPPYRPLDIVQTYAHQTIMNDSLAQGYLDALTERAGVGQVMNAAPLAMGTLTDGGGPVWHPLRKEAGKFEVTREAAELCRAKGTRLEIVASQFGFRKLNQKDGKIVPDVVGCKNVDEVRRTLEGHRDAKGQVGEAEKEVIELFEKRGVRGFSWTIPSMEACS